MTTPLLVSTTWLAEHLHDPSIRIADVRWYLFEKDITGRGEYAKGHIPGAVFVDVDTDLSSPPLQGPGRHPLPTATQFANAMVRAGIGAGTHVICYDDRGGAVSARLWWLLRYFGHDDVSLLDGGIAQWRTENRPLTTDVPQIARANFVPRPRPDMMVNREQVRALANDPRGLVLDVRLNERYTGKTEPLDPRAGHVPGAKNVPLAGNLRAPDDFRFRDPAELRARYDALGANQAETIAAYCGSGINASQAVFALTLAGYANPRLYEGSWSDWSRSELPMKTGEEP
ncbi:MAG: sulfurtransferase [Chloroflexi bacterium]|nr:sulfurtransferase [Chloroflexota bacterium]